jgi:DNA polymerase delta subunit 3
MAEDNYRDYLVARVVTEQKPITYRLLSRVLKTNVNTAKRSVQSVQLFECELT